MNLEDRVKKYIKDNSIIQDGDIVVMGVSGGADSMSLLFLLHTFGYDIRVVHINHGIRGNEAKRDAEFIENYCETNKIPCEIITHNVPKIAKNNHESLEEAGRRIRYEEFSKYAEHIEHKEGKNVLIAVGHHMNDQAETILHNLVRGTGIKGLSGMSCKNNRIVRPLLCLTRQEIEIFVKDNEIPYVTDCTNYETEYTRNLIRHSIVPTMEQLNDRAIEHISNAAEKLGRIDRYLSKNVKLSYEEYVSSKNDVEFLSLDIFENEDLIIIEEVIRQIIKNHTGKLKDITTEHIGMVTDLCFKQVGKNVNLPYGLKITKGYNNLQFLSDEALSDTDNCNQDKSIRIIEVSKLLNKYDYPTEMYTKWFDYDKIVNDAVWRYRRPGDMISIKGGTQKLQDFFTKQKIPQEKRDRILLLADGEEIIWVVGYRISEKYKVSDLTKRILEAKITL